MKDILSQQEMIELAEVIRRTGATRPCPYCGHHTAMAPAAFVNLVLLDAGAGLHPLTGRASRIALQGGGPRAVGEVPAYLSVCEKCGGIRLFSIDRLLEVENAPTLQEPAQA